MSDSSLASPQRRMRNLSRHLREAALLLKGAVSTDHPIMAHIIPIRRCNLSCTYCNEYDDYSKPVPLETMSSTGSTCWADLKTGDHHAERRRAAAASGTRRNHRGICAR